MRRVEDVRFADPHAVKDNIHRTLSKSREVAPEASDGLIDLIYALGYAIVEDTNANARSGHRKH